MKYSCTSFLGMSWMRNIMNQTWDNIIFLSGKLALWFIFPQNLWRKTRTLLLQDWPWAFLKIISNTWIIAITTPDLLGSWASPRSLPCPWPLWPCTCVEEESLPRGSWLGLPSFLQVWSMSTCFKISWGSLPKISSTDSTQYLLNHSLRVVPRAYIWPRFWNKSLKYSLENKREKSRILQFRDTIVL